MRAFALAICDLQLSPYSVVKVLRTGDPVLCAEAPHGTCSAPKRREGDASIHADFAVAGLRGGCPRVMGVPGDWWSRGGSNPRPPPCKGGALPIELRPQSDSSVEINSTWMADGGPSWTRTRDLSLIRTAL